MPVWTRAELQQCRALLFPQISADDVDAIADICGGIARFVMEKDNREHYHQIVDGAIGSADLDAIFQCIGRDDDSQSTAPHILIHAITTNDDFYNVSYSFASDYVCDRLCTELYRRQRDKLMAFLAAPAGPFFALQTALLERDASRRLNPSSA